MSRVGSDGTDIWAFNLQDHLPTLPVPLKAPDKDAVLDLKKALDTIYDRGAYELSVRYEKEPPPPAFPEEEQRWMEGILKGRRK